MKITHLSLTNFRNYSRLELDFSEKIALFVGANAQGKTSILEAIYYIATLSSFQAENDRQLINLTAFQSPLAVARIVADFQRGHHKRQIEIRIIKEEKNGNREGNVHKEVLLDGVKKKSVEVVGTLNAILFVPQMLSVIEGAPEVRRRYMNILLAQVIAGYGEQLSLYHKALTQRNALLKRLNEAGGDVNQLDFWDEQLSESGARIIHARIKALHELGKYAKRAHHSLSRQKEVLRLDYFPSLDPLEQPKSQFALSLDAYVDRTAVTVKEIKSKFFAQLKKERLQDIQKGMTTVGPHRDDFCIRTNGLDLGCYGSRGQIRTAMLSLKIAEMMWMQEKTHEHPILMFDEVLAELDQERREALLESIHLSEQVLCTTTDLNLFNKNFLQHSDIWQINQGNLSFFKL